MRNAYERVSVEYYRRDLHPTCANLRDCTEYGLRAIERLVFGEGRLFCEVGCGLSMLGNSRVFHDSVVVGVDLNAGILSHAAPPVIRADVFALPFGNACLDGIFGSLIDPYNTEEFYREALRVLRPGGRLVFSVPDIEWVRYNRTKEGIQQQVAILSLADGSGARLPSYVYENNEQIAMLDQIGFQDSWRYPVRLEDCVARDQISPRFLKPDGNLVSENAVNMFISFG